MKNYILAIMSLSAFGLTATAADIRGTLMLKGSIKTNITVNGIKSVCRLKVDRVKNLMEEDSFGNPAYKVDVQISLNQAEFELPPKIKMERKLTLTNMHPLKDKLQVLDLDYFNSTENVKLVINSNGRLVSTTFQFQSQTITCRF